jgi:hypothetical protein
VNASLCLTFDICTSEKPWQQNHSTNYIMNSSNVKKLFSIPSSNGVDPNNSVYTILNSNNIAWVINYALPKERQAEYTFTIEGFYENNWLKYHSYNTLEAIQMQQYSYFNLHQKTTISWANKWRAWCLVDWTGAHSHEKLKNNWICFDFTHILNSKKMVTMAT